MMQIKTKPKLALTNEQIASVLFIAFISGSLSLVSDAPLFVTVMKTALGMVWVNVGFKSLEW